MAVEAAAVGYATEEEAAEAFDRTVVEHLLGMFSLYREVPGTLIQPRAGQVDKGVRIDRVLMPRRSAAVAGWTLGAVGVEVKRSGAELGLWLAQSMDYMRSTWTVQGISVQLGAVFLWPCEKQHGPIASVMSHNRVGSASTSEWVPMYLQMGEETVLRVDRNGSLSFGTIRSGMKVGSR